MVKDDASNRYAGLEHACGSSSHANHTQCRKQPRSAVPRRGARIGTTLRTWMWMVGGLSTHPTIGCRQQVIEDRCPARARADRIDCIVVVGHRLREAAGLTHADEQLRSARRAAGLDGIFVVTVGEDARLTDTFNATIGDIPHARLATAMWRHGSETLRHTVALEEAVHGPCRPAVQPHPVVRARQDG